MRPTLGASLRGGTASTRRAAPGVGERSAASRGSGRRAAPPLSVGAWARERLSPTTVGPLVLFLLLATPWPPGAALATAAVVVVVVVGLRLEDDVADVAHDRRVHPGRVLPRAWPAEAAHFGALLAGLTTAGAAGAVALAGPGRAALLAAPRALQALAPLAGRLSRALVGLVKYPALVLVLADPACPRAALVATLAAVWAAFAAHELLHDLALRALPPATPLLSLALATLVVAPLLAGTWPGALVALAPCPWVWRRREGPPGPWCRAPFLAALPTFATRLLEV